jgi:hypothetical protein
MNKVLAKAILAAVEMRESSYDLIASEAAQLANPEKMLDYRKFYRIGLETACNMSAPPGIGRLIFLALDGWWNDTIEWAKEQLKDETEVKDSKVDS